MRRASLEPTKDSPYGPSDWPLQLEIDRYVDARAMPIDGESAVGRPGEDELIPLCIPAAATCGEPSGRFAHDLFNGLHPYLAAGLQHDVDRPPAIRLNIDNLELRGVLVELERVVRVIEKGEDRVDGRWHECVQIDACQ